MEEKRPNANLGVGVSLGAVSLGDVNRILKQSEETRNIEIRR